MDRDAVTAELKDTAYGLGFQIAGVCPAVTPQGICQFSRWLDDVRA